MKTILKIILPVLISMLPACQNDELKNELNSTKWYLQSISSTDTQIENAVPENLSRMYIIFLDSNKLHALSSCNAFDGDFSTAGDSIHIKAGTTKIFCTDNTIRLWDSLFYNNLNNSSKYFIKDGMLSILTSRNTVMMFK